MLQRYPLFAFILMAYAITAVLVSPLALSNRGLIGIAVPAEWEALAAFGPFIAAWIVLRARSDPLRISEFWSGFKRWPVGRNSWLLVVATPFAFLALAIVITATLTDGIPSFTFAPVSWSLLRQVADVVLVASLLQSLGEEPGWRGFLLPELRQRFGPLSATLVLFPIWLLWHSPMIFARPEFSVAQFGGFSLGILSAAVWLTFIYEKTHSLLAAIIWHALVNLTRSIALALSTTTFLAYGAAVSIGAVTIAIWWIYRHINRNQRN